MAIVRLDKVMASYNGNLESLKFGADVTNGVFAHVGSLVAGERELHDAVQPTETSVVSDEVVLHASPEVMYDERKYKLGDFVLEAGKAGRAYHLTSGDVVSLTADLIEGTPVVGEFVVSQFGADILKASADGTIADQAGTGSVTPRFKAEVIEETALDGQTAYAIKVLSV